MALDRRYLTVPLMMPSAQALSVWRGVGGWGWWQSMGRPKYHQIPKFPREYHSLTNVFLCTKVKVSSPLCYTMAHHFFRILMLLNFIPILVYNGYLQAFLFTLCLTRMHALLMSINCFYFSVAILTGHSSWTFLLLFISNFKGIVQE